MAVNNRIATRRAPDSMPDKAIMPDKRIEYKCGDETVKLSPSIIRNYLVSGDGGQVTDQEVAMFLNLCRYQHLNPFLKEAYLIKYGNQPATIVTGKEAIMKRAVRNPNFAGMEAGVVVWTNLNETGAETMEYRPGALVVDGEDLLGGWAKVHVKGYNVPVEAVASYKEYVGRKKDGTINQQWTSKPATMIRKVALVQAMREAFPEDLGGMYAFEEMGVEFNEVPAPPVEPKGTMPEEPPQQQPDDLQDVFQ